jgi:stage III sporulation protein AG
LFKKWLNQADEKGDGGERQKRRFRLMLLLGLVGIGVLFFSSFVRVPAKELTEDGPLPPDAQEPVNAAVTSKPVTMQDYEKKYEEELADVLSKMVGVDDVSIVINLDSTVEEVVQVDVRDTEQVTQEVGKTGDNRSITQNTTDKKTAFYNTGDGQKPVVIKQLKPKVRGVLIVARGVENLRIKAAVIEAIQRTLEVPAHRISVLPKG